VHTQTAFLCKTIFTDLFTVKSETTTMTSVPCIKVLYLKVGYGNIWKKRGVKEKNRYMYRYICVMEQYLGYTGWDLKN
jgi:hypothetical protein